MTDPSVLDFLIAKLKIRRPPPGDLPSVRQLWFEEHTTQTEEQPAQPEAAPGFVDAEIPSESPSRRRWWLKPELGHTAGPPPLAVVSAVVLTFIGLAMLASENGTAVGLVLLAGAAGSVFFAVRRGEIPVTADALPTLGEDSKMRLVPAGAAAAACIVTGVAAADNSAGPVLLVAWLLSVALAVAAVLPSPRDGWRILRPRPGGESHSLALPMLIMAAAVLVRTSHLTTVPAEMISEHAELILAILRADEPAPPIVFPWGPGGLEPIPIYLGAVLASLAGGLSFTSLKLGTLLAGLLTLPVIYLLGREVGGRPVGLAGMALAAVGPWPDLVSRIGLTQGWYPPLAGATVLLLLRGAIRCRRIDFATAGLAMGLAIQTTSMARSLVVMAVVLLGVAWIPAHPDRRRRLLAGLGVVVVFAGVAGLPTLVAGRPSTGEVHRSWWIGAADGARDHDSTTGLAERTGRALIMPLWSNGPAWNHGGNRRPALDRATAVLLVVGLASIAVGAACRRRLIDLLLLISLPLALLPAVLAPLQPELTPSPLRCGGALATVFVIAGLGLAAIVRSTASSLAPSAGRLIASATALVFVGLSATAGRTVVHTSFAHVWDESTWNASELGSVVRGAMTLGVTPERAWVVAYPHWVDTRLVAAEAGLPGEDLAIDPGAVRGAARKGRARIFLVHPGDRQTLRTLERELPDAEVISHRSRVPGKSFSSVMSATGAGVD